ncbi:MAG TPA: NADP-dependent oxidoreductase [Bacteroidales bacterium]|nr:NADP-dependent oxidoreductase [Bacteroidales bacterium]
MKAVLIKEFGDRSKLEVAEVQKPEPEEGEVLVRIKAAGVNPVDYRIREGQYHGRMPYEFPIILGWDVAGVVEKNGHGASRFDPGEEVFAYARRKMIKNGTYAEYICLPESFLAYKPKSLSFEEAAAVPLASLTAYQSLLVKGKLMKDERVLIVGATGGVGSFAVQIAKAVGASVVAMASKKNISYAISLGASDFVDYSSDNLNEEIAQRFPDKFDLVFDCVGNEALERAYNFVKPAGRLVSIRGQVNQEEAEKHKLIFHYHFVEPNVKHLNQVSQWIGEGKVKVHVEHKFPLEEAAKAQEMIETGHTKGKIVLVV